MLSEYGKNNGWLDINEPRIHKELFDEFGNRFNIPIVEEYQMNCNQEWVLQKRNSYSENYYLLGNKLYLRFGNKLMPLETDCDVPHLHVYWKLIGIITDFTRITGNFILFENKYRQLKRQDYSDGTCFFTLHQWVELPYPHYKRDFKVDEGADNLQELIDYMNRQRACSYKYINQELIQNNPQIKEHAESIISKETELIEFMKQLQSNT